MISEVRLPVAPGDLLEHIATGRRLVLCSWNIDQDVYSQRTILVLRVCEVADCLGGLLTVKDENDQVEFIPQRADGNGGATSWRLSVEIEQSVLLGHSEGLRALAVALGREVRLIRCAWMRLVPSAMEDGWDAAAMEARRQVIGAVVPQQVTVYSQGVRMARVTRWPWDRAPHK